jgi:hypothetical protein
VAAVGALFQNLSDSRLHHQLGELPLSSQQQAWFANNLGSGNVDAKLKQLDPGTAHQVGRVLKETFVHSLTSSLRLSSAVALAGAMIAVLMLRGQPRPAGRPVRAQPAPEPSA